LHPSFDMVWHGIGAQLRKPSGFGGRIAGGVMAFANAKPNALAVAALGLRHGESLLELGCGPGHALHALLRSAALARAIGLDWSEVMLARAADRNRSAIATGRLALVRGDFAALPFRAESTDAVLAVNVVYFMGSSAAVREAHRVLRSGGRIVFYASDRSAMGRWPFAGPDTHRLFNQDELAALLVEAGFAAESIRIDIVDAGFGVKGLLAKAQKKEG
jgi:ubiquinone/menaquinone biosynthesis C-methylase UbiE